MTPELPTPFYSADNATIFHGDSLDILEAIAAHMPESFDYILTDPPYASGGRQQASARNVVTKNNAREDDTWFLGDNMGSDSWMRWQRQIARHSLRACVLGAHAYVCIDWRQLTNLVTAWESVGWSYRTKIVWDKNNQGMGSFWRNTYEEVAVFTKGMPLPLKDGTAFNLFRCNKPRGGYHPTEKPVELMHYILSKLTTKTGRVLDPFMGSGTTLEAARQLALHGYGIDFNPEFCARAAKRVSQALLPTSTTPAPAAPSQLALP